MSARTPRAARHAMHPTASHPGAFRSPIASIVIPAHDEEHTIARCLAPFRDAASSGEFEVLVVCNGCTDATASCARAFEGVTVLELDAASKIEALRAGDRTARHWPRLYLDADIEMSASDVRLVVEALERGPALVASPRPRIDCRECSVGVRMFYAVWTRLPYVRRGPIGAGAYAISRVGRARFSEFPQVIADDGFVECLFQPSERASVSEATMIIRAPRTLRDLVRIERRRRIGKRQLETSGLMQFQPQSKGQLGTLMSLVLRPTLWPALAVYVGVRVAAAGHARTRGASAAWARDESSRQPTR